MRMLGKSEHAGWKRGCGRGCCNNHQDSQKSLHTARQGEKEDISAEISAELELTEYDRGWDAGEGLWAFEPNASDFYIQGYLEARGLSSYLDRYYDDISIEETPYRTETPK